MVYPNNVIHMATESSNKSHSAVFPVELPSWFIRLFTEMGDTVLDPFIGSGTTAVAALMLNRHYVGIDTNLDFVNLSEERLHNKQVQLRSLRLSTVLVPTLLIGKAPKWNH